MELLQQDKIRHDIKGHFKKQRSYRVLAENLIQGVPFATSVFDGAAESRHSGSMLEYCLSR